jgi:membrane protein DedA with SNARE-associated domain
MLFVLWVSSVLSTGSLCSIFSDSSIGNWFAGLGGLGVLLLAVGDSSFLSLPEGNDLLIVVLSAGGTWAKMAYWVAMTVIGSVIGCFILYSVGRKGGQAILRKKFSPEKIERAEKIYNKYGILAVLIPSILPPPLPFKIFVLSAGIFELSTPRFLAAVTVGRAIRYSMWGILAVLYGNSVKLFLKNNLTEIGTGLAIAVILIIAGTVVYYIRKKSV